MLIYYLRHFVTKKEEKVLVSFSVINVFGKGSSIFLID
jgi:hypothetical protein